MGQGSCPLWGRLSALLAWPIPATGVGMWEVNRREGGIKDLSFSVR